VTHFLEQNPDISDEFDYLKSPVPELNLNVFKNKGKIKKSFSELPESQFELLCASFYEGDLNAESEAELRQILETNHERRKIFGLFGRVKLAPSSVVYKNKQHLKRITPLGRVIRLSLIGLSSAAAIALFLAISYITLRNISDNPGNTARDFPVYPDLKEKYFEIPSGIAIRKDYSVKPILIKRILPDQNYTAVLSAPDTTTALDGKVATEDLKVSPIPVGMISLKADADVHKNEISSLLPSYPVVIMQTEDVYMSNVERFVAKVFREKILREKPTKETPLKGYEIAEAGVAGLNKLLGWEMALNEKNDENGDLKSVYFSSKILKFNAPVKKIEEEQ
jgi:hypothetical protein